MPSGRFLVFVVCLAAAGRADAQAVKIQFEEGAVSLSAQNATPRQILAEWARVGGTRIVNGERVPGTPMTIELSRVSERQALDVILRSASGYMAAARTTGTGLSKLDRVHILPTSTAAPARPGAAPAAGARPTPPRPMVINPPVQVPEDDVQEPEEVEEPRPATPARLAPGQMIGGRPGGNPPFPMNVNVPDADDVDVEDEPPAVTPTPGNPFGVAPGSNRPGVVNPPPRPAGQPGNTTQPIP